jgi:cyclase
LLEAGADKVAVNSAAVARPQLISEISERLGAQCAVLALDAARCGERYEVAVRGASQRTTLDAIEWASRAVALGAGEILATSIDRDGTREGYDLELVRRLALAVRVPVIASGGAGQPSDLVDAFESGADAVLVASLFHERSQDPASLKRFLFSTGVEVRT